MGFPCGLDSTKSVCKAGKPGLIPGFGRSPREGHDYPLQYSHLENSMDRGAWQATVLRATKTEWLTLSLHFQHIYVQAQALTAFEQMQKFLNPSLSGFFFQFAKLGFFFKVRIPQSWDKDQRRCCQEKTFCVPGTQPQKCSLLFKISDLSLETGKDPKKKRSTARKVSVPR